MLDNKRDQIQQDAFNAWLNNGKIGTVEQATGTGKTFVSFRCILSMPKGSNVLFLAETVVREQTVLEDAIKYKTFYGVDPLKDYNVKFGTYQGAYKYDLWDYFPDAHSLNTIIVFDEIHDIISDKRIEFVLKSQLSSIHPFSKIPKVGLSATIDKTTEYLIQGEEITKLNILNKFCPIVYVYSLQESITNKTTRNIKFFVLKHNLNSVGKTIHVKTKEHDFYTTEQASYARLNQDLKVAMFAKYKDAKAKTARMVQVASRRARFLHSLESKRLQCISLINSLPGRTLVFGQDSQTLLSICPNAIVSENANYVQDLADFKAGKTSVTCSNKILKQGENIPGLDNLILLAYNSKIKDWTQMVGEWLAHNSI